MQTKTLQQTVTFKASPREVYDMLMDSKKHRSLSAMQTCSKRGTKEAHRFLIELFAFKKAGLA